MFKPRILDSQPVEGEAPRILYRNEDILAVEKPAGWLTHSDGQHQRPDVVSFLGEKLGVHQRLDVDTSGVICLSLSSKGAKQLSAVFEGGLGQKTYLAVTEGFPPEKQGVIDRPVPTAPHQQAITHYRTLRKGKNWALLELQPKTGRTHQIRAHLQQLGCPCRGDLRYGDPLSPKAFRTLLHCASIQLPDGRRIESPPPPDFARYLGLSPQESRAHLTTDLNTTCFRELNGEGDGCPGLYVDRYDRWLWVQQDEEAPAYNDRLLPESEGIYLIEALRDRSHGEQTGVVFKQGSPAPLPLTVLEHGIAYAAELGTQLSTGLFLDQRPQRAYLRRHASGLRVLNTFAHAGGFSVAAALGGAQTVSIDLSQQWLSHIPQSLALNGLPSEPHDQIYGDVFDWMRRLGKRGEKFDLVILDPPSTSVGIKKKRWSAARDYPELVALALPLLSPGGALWTLCNLAQLSPLKFANAVSSALPQGALLERVCPPAVDFASDQVSRVKTFCWRL